MTTLFISHSSKDKAWAERIQEALSDADYQCLFLDSHPDDGIHAGADWERTLYQRLRQSRGVVVLCSANWLASPWCVAEAMMARERKRRVFLLVTADVVDDRQVKGAPDAAPKIPDFLKDTQFISLADTTKEVAHQQLLKGLEREGLRKRDFKLPDRPYPGLKPFGEDDAAIFFGRDDEIDQVIDVLHRRRKGNAKGFILVLGASGCGKSSLVRAGVLPQLTHAGNDAAAPTEWVVVPPSLTGRGLDGLALSLAKACKLAGQPRELATMRRQLSTVGDLRTLANELMLAKDLSEGSVLLVLDQLEEVFSTPEDSDARAALRLLLDASADPASPVVVLATMRSDFLNFFQLFEGSAERCEEVTLYPMLRSRFHEVIEGPAERFGLDLDPGLSQRMVEDTAYDDALPLLAFTLEKLYEHGHADGRLTLAEYEGLFPPVEVVAGNGARTTEKGVAAAIKKVADEILEETGFAGLSEEDLRMRDLRSAFFRLAQVGREGQFTRRTARREDVTTSDSVAKVLQKFENQRLLVSGVDDENYPTLSVAHEALFRVWNTLRGWLLKDREALALRAQIEEAAAEWDREDRAESRAWPEERIIDAMREIELSGVSLADVKDRATVDAFLGPTDPEQIKELPALTAADDHGKGSGRCGGAWRLPLSHEARASVGVRLALLGDPRPGVGQQDGLPDIDWVWIDGGEVTIEILADPNDPRSEVKDRLTRAVDSFWMARYPVTITQFQAFMKDCYPDGQWRLAPGFPFDYKAVGWPPPKHRARYGNHPVDNVSWIDAAAFCYWMSVKLTERLGKKMEIQLPTEFQWQLAATGGDPKRTYPWSDPLNPDWNPQKEPWRANTAESESGRSTAVGMYPAGVSPAGVLDMAGTLWEWCLNEFEDVDNTAFPASQQDRRVLRGGSWGSARGGARSTNRGRGDPGYRLNRLSFRVVCSSPSLATDH